MFYYVFISEQLIIYYGVCKSFSSTRSGSKIKLGLYWARATRVRGKQPY